jgi:predicted nucleic acid-binding protein
MIFVDTNIWCYFFDARLPEHEHVKGAMREVLMKETVTVNTVIVMEVAHYLTRNLGESEAKRKVEVFVTLRNMKILDFNRALMGVAVDYLTTYARSDGLGGRDSTIIASLSKFGIKSLLTHDRALGAFAKKLGFESIDPIPRVQ